jgi:hypothetical protein
LLLLNPCTLLAAEVFLLHALLLLLPPLPFLVPLLLPLLLPLEAYTLLLLISNSGHKTLTPGRMPIKLEIITHHYQYNSASKVIW